MELYVIIVRFSTIGAYEGVFSNILQTPTGDKTPVEMDLGTLHLLWLDLLKPGRCFDGQEFVFRSP